MYAILAVVALRLIWQMEPRARWWRIPVALAGLAAPVLAYKSSALGPALATETPESSGAFLA